VNVAVCEFLKAGLFLVTDSVECCVGDECDILQHTATGKHSSHENTLMFLTTKHTCTALQHAFTQNCVLYFIRIDTKLTQNCVLSLISLDTYLTQNCVLYLISLDTYLTQCCILRSPSGECIFDIIPGGT
jgi:hypothetical protein